MFNKGDKQQSSTDKPVALEFPIELEFRMKRISWETMSKPQQNTSNDNKKSLRRQEVKKAIGSPIQSLTFSMQNNVCKSLIQSVTDYRQYSWLVNDNVDKAWTVHAY